MSRDSSVGTATAYSLDGPGSGVDSRWGLEIFLFTTASRQALRPTQPPIQGVLRVLSPGVKRPGREAGHSPNFSAEVKNEWSYTSTPNKFSWRGAYLSTGTTLPLLLLLLLLFIYFWFIFSFYSSLNSPTSLSWPDFLQFIFLLQTPFSHRHL
jgi:hypothetical protein